MSFVSRIAPDSGSILVDNARQALVWSVGIRKDLVAVYGYDDVVSRFEATESWVELATFEESVQLARFGVVDSQTQQLSPR